MTPAQQRIHSAILEHWSTYGVPPCVRDLATALGVQVNAIHPQLKRMQRDGILVKDKGQTARGILPVVLAEGVKAIAGMLVRTEARRAAA